MKNSMTRAEFARTPVPPDKVGIYVLLRDVRPRDQVICGKLLEAVGNPMLVDPVEEWAEDAGKRCEIAWAKFKRTRLYAALLQQHRISRNRGVLVPFGPSLGNPEDIEGWDKYTEIVARHQEASTST